MESFDLRYAYSIERREDLEKKYPYTKFFYGEEGLSKIVEEKDLYCDVFVEDIEYVQGLYPDNENTVRDAAYLSDKLYSYHARHL